MGSSEATWIEFHDSYVTGIALGKDALILSLHAVVHANAEGSLPTSGWQNVELTFEEYAFTCEGLGLRDELDTYISHETLLIAGEKPNELLSSTAKIDKPVNLTLVISPDFRESQITAASLHIRALDSVEWET